MSEETSVSCERPEDARALMTRLLKGYRGQVGIRLGNDDWVVGHRRHPCILTVFHPGTIRDFACRQDLQALIDGYLQGDIDASGDLAVAGDLACHLAERQWPWYERLALGWQARRLERLPRPNTMPAVEAVSNGRMAVHHHYDRPNAFFRLWLDPEMVYSGAYFHSDEQSLAEAQRDKLDDVCRKLQLAPGDTLLDVGCGWGGLLCWAGHHYAVQAHGITISRPQYEFVRRRIEAEGLSERVSVELRDYRHLAEGPRYDKIASINLIEHVGGPSLLDYFAITKRLLKPGGLMLTHGVTSEHGWQANAFTRFINGYVAPDAELSRLGDVSGALEESGFELYDVESRRRHYALTLRHWSHRLDGCADAARRMAGDSTYRLWRLYLAGATHGFEQGRLNAYEVLAGHAGEPAAVPLRRPSFTQAKTKSPPPVPWSYRRAA